MRAVHPMRVVMCAAALVFALLMAVSALAQDRGKAEAAKALAVTAVADRVRLHQILINLISNGVKFSSRGGSVTVAVGTRSRCLKQQIHARLGKYLRAGRP